MLKFITVFNPSFSKNEEDAERQLLLFHSFQSFQEGHAFSLNDKIAQLGVIQAMWQFSKTFNESQGISQSVVELEDTVLCTILVENSFFLTLCFAPNELLDIPASYILANLRHCYDFSTLHFGLWGTFENHTQLTDRLNEFLVPFWAELNLMPYHLWHKGFLSSWPECYKVAEIKDDIKDGDTSSTSWEADLKQQILVDDSTFLGLQDILVYHLPKTTSGKSNKEYGLVHNFAPDFDWLPQISNWIEHLDTVYTVLSSHVLAGNVKFKEAVDEESMEEPNINNQEVTTSQSLLAQSRKIFNNFTYPLTFAHDAVQEVGNMTGISSSMSLLSDFMPKVPSWKMWPGPEDSKTKAARSDFLVSPLSASFLPESYKVKKMHLSYGGVVQRFNCLFWFYNETLVVLIYKENFDKIWDHEYLHDIHFKLSQSIAKLYSSNLNETAKNGPDSFCYAVVTKKTRRLRSSFPLNKILKDPESTSALELVVNGLDEFLALGPNRKTSVATLNPSQNQANFDEDAGKQSWGLSLMGGIFKKSQADSSLAAQPATFLDGVPEEKLRLLHLDINKFVNTLSTSRRASDLKEEKLIKLNNGVLCFLSENSEEIVVLVENWFDKKLSKTKHLSKGNSALVQHMGSEAFHWWRNNTRA
ncbi:LAFA_0G10572g1_1 [Lachancea sp. 'fantastica']|nr:LAFA_0G10572g1_1 [Lachancea sp. 'fantastica']